MTTEDSLNRLIILLLFFSSLRLYFLFRLIIIIYIHKLFWGFGINKLLFLALDQLSINKLLETQLQTACLQTYATSGKAVQQSHPLWTLLDQSKNRLLYVASLNWIEPVLFTLREQKSQDFLRSKVKVVVLSLLCEKNAKAVLNPESASQLQKQACNTKRHANFTFTC